MNKASEKCIFEIVRENLRSVLRYMRYDLQMPPEMVRLQFDAIMNSFLIEELNKSLDEKGSK